MTFFVCFLAALAGLLFGLDIGVIAGALPFIADEFQITSHTQEWVVSSMMFRCGSRCGGQRLALL
ncbi:MFS transporter [Escherichia coli]|uniref:MFS transporter n=1 Tax=Escherichia coli TaxID=562 RepID=UPI00254798C9|nr:MFS transporter [Escherichia coli]